jgi:uncharacterized SAM-binding protein YcdF (DUF218 family)
MNALGTRLLGLHRRHRIWSSLLGSIAVAFVLWGLGFVWFLGAISQPRALPPHADGILAVTGGAERVETALRLLAAGRANRLLVSGTGPATELRTLGQLAGVDTARLADRVTLGRMAASTRGNAVETALWIRETGTASLIVVTGYYHMPRTLTELESALSGVVIYPFPVGGEAGHRAAPRLLVEEYTKYLLALAGVTAWLPQRLLPQREPPHGVAAS